MAVRSAGILLYRRRNGIGEVFLIHPGGPYWAKKDMNAWSVPKGIVGEGEDPLLAARREFQEETGFEVDGEYLPLGTFRQPSGKQLSVWAIEGDADPARLVSNSFEMVWPPKSGRMQQFPEADRSAWFSRAQAQAKIVKGQRPIVQKLFEAIAPGRGF
ncbi:MAG TPA: NUDIX domain-containing protein [Rhizomicrobium sp.]|nr:NUDIX domain-containing protein [Rhizomicrobium sp.]